MATTALDIIKKAMILDGILGVMDILSSQDANDGLVALNMMLEQWSLEDLMCYYSVNETFSTVDGTASYTIGSGGTINTTRPVKITYAFARSSNIDSPLQLMANEEYQNIVYKTLESIPGALYYSPEYPLGKIWLYPVPDAVYTIGISSLKQLSQFAALSTALSMPPGYLKALIYNLAVEICPQYKKNIDEIVYRQARESKALIKRVNEKEPELHLESVLLGRGAVAQNSNNSGFNIYAGF